MNFSSNTGTGTGKKAMKTKVNNKIQRSYVSDISKLLNTLSQNHPKTESQRQEIDKATRITAKMTK